MKKEKRFEMKKFLRRFIPGVMALAMVLSATSITTAQLRSLTASPSALAA